MLFQGVPLQLAIQPTFACGILAGGKALSCLFSSGMFWSGPDHNIKWSGPLMGNQPNSLTMYIKRNASFCLSLDKMISYTIQVHWRTLGLDMTTSYSYPQAYEYATPLVLWWANPSPSNQPGHLLGSAWHEAPSSLSRQSQKEPISKTFWACWESLLSWTSAELPNAQSLSYQIHLSQRPPNIILLLVIHGEK